jgi:hypothetical protein
MRDRLAILCSFCGHFKRSTRDDSEQQVTSASWVQALEKYRVSPPVLTQY